MCHNHFILSKSSEMLRHFARCFRSPETSDGHPLSTEPKPLLVKADSLMDGILSMFRSPVVPKP